MRQKLGGYIRTAWNIYNILHGSVATFLRCDGNVHDDCDRILKIGQYMMGILQKVGG